MSEDKHVDKDPERTLVTLEQLSQTIEVMSSVVNRLRQHFSEQLKAQADAEGPTEEAQEEVQAETIADTAAATEQKKESFVVEIRQQEELPVPKNGKNLH